MNYKSFSTVVHERELQPKHKLMEKLIAFCLTPSCYSVIEIQASTETDIFL